MSPPVPLALVAIAVLAGCTPDGADESAPSDAIIGASGEPTEIAAQDGWRLVAQDSNAGPCLQLFANDDTGYGCGFGVPELRSIGYFPTLLGEQRFLAGPVTPDVARVRVEFGDGTRRGSDVLETSEGPHVYVVRVPDRDLEAVVALSSDGEEIERVETPSDPWGS